MDAKIQKNCQAESFASEYKPGEHWMPLVLTDGPKDAFGERWSTLVLTDGSKEVPGEHWNGLVLTEEWKEWPRVHCDPLVLTEVCKSLLVTENCQPSFATGKN